MIAIILAIGAFFTGLRSAWLWHQASVIKVVPTWAMDRGSEPGDAQASQAGWLAGQIIAGNKSAELNRKAAIWTAATVVLGTAANLVNTSL